MRIALLKTDYVDADLMRVHGDLPNMFSRFFNEVRDTALDVFEVHLGDFPNAYYRCDAFVISGSRFSVNAEKPWIMELIAFIRSRASTDTFIGICFGHQVLAKTFDARIEPNATGPNVGVRTLRLRSETDWAQPFYATPGVLFNHAEQVASAPQGAAVIAGDSVCPTQIIQYGRRALGLQAHPEYTTWYQEDLMRLNKKLDRLAYEDALARNRSVKCDNALIRKWILTFIDLAGQTATQ